jgi:hypothetical protein
MAEVKQLLEEKHNFSGLSLTLTDLYPNTEAAEAINSQSDTSVRYLTEPVDATNVQKTKEGLRTIICSMDHMRPETAKSILKAANLEDWDEILADLQSDDYT